MIATGWRRKELAADLLKAAIPALGLDVRQAARGPFDLVRRWPEGLKVTDRTLWYWFLPEGHEDRHYPAGKRLELVERFLGEALAVLKKRKVVRKSLGELLAKP